jgi:hypothetical protein
MASSTAQLRQPIPADLEERRIQFLELAISFAQGGCDAVAFDAVIPHVLGGYGSAEPQITPEEATQQAEQFRRDLKAVLWHAAAGEEWSFPAETVMVEGQGHKMWCVGPLMTLRWQAVAVLLRTQLWRLRICEGHKAEVPWRGSRGKKCRPLFARRGRSDYCHPGHAGATQRWRHQQRKMTELTSQGES